MLRVLGGAVAIGVAARGLRALRAAVSRDLEDAVVLVAGGSRGLGLALARMFLARGARVAICAREAESLQRAVESLGQSERVAGVQCDVAKRAEVAAMTERVVERFGRLDVVVNVAGTIVVGPYDVMTEHDFRDMMDTHFWGMLWVIWEALPHLRRSKGRIVNVTSIGGLIAVPHLLPYSASKFAQVGLSEGLGAELALEGISVTTVCPGLMRTGSPKNAWFKGRHVSEYAWFNLSASSPLSSISARSAARRIVEAALARERFVVLSIQAQALATLHALFPGATRAALSLVNRFLPRSPADGELSNGGGRFRGSESESPVTRSALTAMGRAAEGDLNQNR